MHAGAQVRRLHAKGGLGVSEGLSEIALSANPLGGHRVYIFGAFNGKPLKYHEFGSTEWGDTPRSGRDKTICGLTIFDNTDRYDAALPERIAAKIATPCRKCFEVSDD